VNDGFSPRREILGFISEHDPGFAAMDKANRQFSSDDNYVDQFAEEQLVDDSGAAGFLFEDKRATVN
jgi:hypothetical protein